MIVEPAVPEDVPAIMALERGDGFEKLVGRWDAEEHRRAFAAGDVLYLIARDEEGVCGFSMVQHLRNPNRGLRLRRIAVRAPGAGMGRALLAATLDHCFARLNAHRVDLDVFLENERAYRAYLRAGFVEEGVMRDCHRDPDGRFRSMRLMSILRPEWAACRP